MKTISFTTLLLLTVVLRNAPAEDLWDRKDWSARSFDFESLSTRKAPLYLLSDENWMNTGDSWVVKRKPETADGDEKTKANPISDPNENSSLLIEEFFITAGGNDEGPNRIFCASARPEEATGPVPVVFVFHGGGGHASGALAVATARRHPGMAAVAVDYNGQFRPGPEGRVTQWKTVTAEMRGPRFDLVPDLTRSPMWHFVMAARRCLDFVETRAWADPDAVGAVGISYGGWVSLILAGVDSRVKCVTTGVSAGGAGLTAGRTAKKLRWEPEAQRQIWLDHFEPLAHAPNTKAAVFFQLATNDLFFWLNGAAENLAMLPGEKGWVLRPNSNHGAGGPEVPGTAAPAFMHHHLAVGPALPAVSEFSVSGDGRRYTWRATGPNPIHRCVLNWSPASAVSPARYWIEFPATREGNLWKAEIPAELAGLCSEAFVNAGDTHGIVVSSTLLSHNGIDPMKEPAPHSQWPGGQVWDVQRGAAAWRTPAGWLAPTQFEVTPESHLRLGPVEGKEEFLLLTNSVVLASGIAKTHSGLRLHLDGKGEAGNVKVSLLRDTNSLDERAWTVEIDYPAGPFEREVAWSDFRFATPNVDGSPPPAPFDGLTLAGKRNSANPLVVESIRLIDP